MAPYPNRDQLVVFVADGTTVDAFHAGPDEALAKSEAGAGINGESTLGKQDGEGK